MLTALAALICIILAFVSALVNEPILFSPLLWLIASIALSLLGEPGFGWRRRADG